METPTGELEVLGNLPDDAFDMSDSDEQSSDDKAPQKQVVIRDYSNSSGSYNSSNSDSSRMKAVASMESMAPKIVDRYERKQQEVKKKEEEKKQHEDQTCQQMCDYGCHIC